MSRRVKSFGGQKVTLPIKDKRELDRFMLHLLKQKEEAKSEIKRSQSDRNWMMCLIGFNTAFRAEDLLQLRVDDVMNGYVSIKENKTGKMQNFRMNGELHRDILSYIERHKLNRYDYMFIGQKKLVDGKAYYRPITRQQGLLIIKSVADAVMIPYRLGLHSLRKTFAYQYLAKGGNLETLRKMLNHSNPMDTIKYSMWDRDDAENDRFKVYLGGVHKGKKTRN